MFLLYPIAKTTVLFFGLFESYQAFTYVTCTHKKYKDLTVHQQNVVANMSQFTKPPKRDYTDNIKQYSDLIDLDPKTNQIEESSVNPIGHINRTLDLIDVYAEANEIKKSFDELHPDQNSLSQPKTTETISQYRERNKNPLNDYESMMLEKIDPLLQKYAEKYFYPTMEELRFDIFKEQ